MVNSNRQSANVDTVELATGTRSAYTSSGAPSAGGDEKTPPSPPRISKKNRGLDGHQEDSARYVFREILGHGAFAEIYSAFDRNVGRCVAVKTPHQATLKRPEKLNFFLHEARIIAALQHPNIIPLYDLDLDDDQRPYFTMRQIDGFSLGAAIDRALAGDLLPEIKTFSDRVNIILKVLDALAYAHNAGIIHQDIKPDNIMIGKFGEVMLSDWGTACFTAEYPQGRLIGTPLFMPPEQSQRQPLRATNDIYAVGATFYNLLTLQYPMDDTDSEKFWDKKFSGILDEIPAAIKKQIPPPLLAIARKSMHVNAEQRYDSAEAMARDLRNFLNGSAVSAHRDSIRDLAVRGYRRHRGIISLAIAAGLLLLLLGGMLIAEKQVVKELRAEKNRQ